MLNQWLCVLFQASPELAQGFAMDGMQTAKNAAPKWVRVGAWLVVSTIGSLYNVFWKEPPAGLNYVSCLMSLLVIIVSFYFFYESSFRRQIVISLILILAVFSAELFTGMLMWKVICQGCFLHDISPYIKKPNKHAKISLNITSFANIIIEKPTNFCYTYFYN